MTILRTSIITISIFLSIVNLTSQGSGQGDEDTRQVNFIRAAIDSAMRANDIPAISVGLVKNGSLIYAEGFGVYARTSSKKVDENSLYQIGSDTKKLTAIVVRNLVNEEKLDLEASISVYLPKLSLEAQSKLRSVRLRDLLLHRAGIPNRAPRNKRIDGEPMLIPYLAADLLADLEEIQLDFIPDSKFSYSNFGYAILGYICEQVSGMPYPKLIRKYLVEAYGLENTTVQLRERQKKNLVTPYRKTDRLSATSHFNMGLLAAAGGVYSNIKDASRLMIAQIKAYQNSKYDESLLILTDFKEESGNEYGFGLGKSVFETGTQYGHGGDLDGFASGYVFSPEYDLGLVLLSSSGGAWFGALEKEIMHMLTGRALTIPEKSLAQGFFDLVVTVGLPSAQKWFQEKVKSKGYYLSAEEMNNVGYAALEGGHTDDAILIFQMNRDLFPNNANAYDSLGEAYEVKGELQLALENYEKSIEIEPNNDRARLRINELRAK